MGKIYGGVQGIRKPRMQRGIDKWLKKEGEYVQKIVDYAKANGTCPEAGEEINFPVGDGKARYIILSLKPVELIHLDIGDGWGFPYAHRLMASDIRKELKRQEALAKLFSKPASKV